MMTSDAKGATGARESRLGKAIRDSWPDLLCVLAAALISAAVVWPLLSLYKKSLPPDLVSYPFMYNPSAMMGTGHGFVEGVEENYPELSAFLKGETTSLAPRDLDESAMRPVRGPFQLTHYYLVKSLGCWWRLFGVSIPTFLGFSGLLYALCAVALYGLFRVGCGRFVSLLGTACMATSPAWLVVATSLRDFSKAPFVLAFLALAAWCARHRFTGRGLAAWSILTGIILGVGWGFRSDIAVCFPPALLLPWVVRLDGARSWRWRAASCLALLMAVALIGSPVIIATRNSQGYEYVHTMMQGLSERSESAMHFGDAGHVQFGDWLDPSSWAAADVYALRHGGIAPAPCSPSYFHWARQYVAETMCTFPADFFRRGLASFFTVSSVTADACRNADLYGPVPSPVVDFCKRLHRPLAEHLETFGMFYVMLALALGFALDFRTTAILAVLAVYFGAYPSVLYQPKHYFYLSFLHYWAVAWLLTVFGRRLLLRIRGGRGQISLRAAASGIASVLVLVGLLEGTARVLDLVQDKTVQQLQDRYRGAPLEAVPCRETPRKDGWVLYEPLSPVPGLEWGGGTEMPKAAQALLAMRMDWAPPVFPVRIVYERGGMTDFTQDVFPLVYDLSKETPLTCFLSVVELNCQDPAAAAQPGGHKGERGHFVGIAVPESRRDLIRGLFRVTNGAQCPLHLSITVPDDPSRFLAGKSGPWRKQWELFRASRGGTPETTAVSLCAAAQRYPYDSRVRRSLESLLEAHRSPFVWCQAWTSLASLNPDRSAEAGLALDLFAGERSASGDLQAAVDLYRAAIDAVPGTQGHRVNLGKAYEEFGRTSDALAQYLDALAHDPENSGVADDVDQLYDAEKDIASRLAAWQALCGQHPTAFIPAYHLALACTASGDAGRALAEHERAFRISPEHAAQLMDYGRALLDAGDCHRAAEMFSKAGAGDAALAERAAELCDRAADERLKGGDSQNANWLFGQALELRRTAVRVSPDDHWNKLNLARAYERLGRNSEAVAQYLDALAHDPESPETADHVDQMHDAEKDIAGRLSAWQALCSQHPTAFIPAYHLALACTASGDAGRALAEHERAFKLNPEHAAQLVDYGRALLDAGDWERAAVMFRNAAERDRPRARVGAEHCAKAADERLKAGDAQTAIRLYRQALELNPDDPGLRLKAASAMKTEGDLQGALDVLAAAMAQSPDENVAQQMDQVLESVATPEERVSRWRVLAAEHAGCVACRVHLGMALEKAGNPAEAQREYEAVLHADPNQQLARLRLGAAMAAQGREAEGLALVTQAVADAPSLVQSGAQVFADAAARHLGEKEGVGAALDAYSSALAIFPDAPPLLLGQCEALEQVGDHASAMDVCFRLLTVDPESPKAAKMLNALCRSSNPKLPECTVLWGQIVQGRPESAMAQLHFGLALEAAGDAAGAEAAYRQALSRDPKIEADSALFAGVKKKGKDVQ